MALSPRQVKSFCVWFAIHGGLIFGAIVFNSQGFGEVLLGTSMVLMGVPLFVLTPLCIWCYFLRALGRLKPNTEQSLGLAFDLLMFSFVAFLPWLFVWNLFR